MARLLNLPEQGIIGGFKGVVNYSTYMGIAYARRWPRSPGHRRAPAVMAQWEAFSYATKLWPYLTQEIRDAFNTSAAGTNLSGRDLAQKAYLSGYL